MSNLYKSLSDFKRVFPSWTYFVWDTERSENGNPTDHYSVFYGNPDIFAEENESSRSTWHVVYIGMSLEAANEFCKKLNEYPYDLKIGDRVKIKSTIPSLIPHHVGRVATVAEFQHTGTIIIKSDIDEDEEIIEFVIWCYPTELEPYYDLKLTPEELYFSTFV